MFGKIRLVAVLVVLAAMVVMAMVVAGCDGEPPKSDQEQQQKNEQLSQEANRQVGFPAIKNFREKKIVKDIYELRDQANLLTYTYIYCEYTGKFTFVGETVGYGIPYALQFSNPEKIADSWESGYAILPQAEPNGLFTPDSADGTWILMKQPDGKVTPQYIEPRIAVFTYKLSSNMVQQ